MSTHSGLRYRSLPGCPSAGAGCFESSGSLGPTDAPLPCASADMYRKEYYDWTEAERAYKKSMVAGWNDTSKALKEKTVRSNSASKYRT